MPRGSIRSAKSFQETNARPILALPGQKPRPRSPESLVRLYIPPSHQQLRVRELSQQRTGQRSTKVRTELHPHDDVSSLVPPLSVSTTQSIRHIPDTNYITVKIKLYQIRIHNRIHKIMYTMRKEHRGNKYQKG
jgi:hypothetical protein